ncbi:carboxylesterase family protein [Streptomyces sp. HU2014]|uniref:carboxylesterase/lipase family protein n=1 Tax=Streptomyces sp. HU2014 TaxID=2939414 RepID=UPI00200D5841|nr:carboxylesterase family protein [Streptomyces sp. HU2014]UQI45461.1 carboxylesterase family protein [Streptomyces sp. HU2014]
MTGTGVQVRTTAGTVAGLRDGEGLAVFRGVPFARPPVGTLRFAAPRPPLPWAGVRDAAAFGPSVPQSGPAPVPGPAAGENWLTVNVWSPDPGGGAGLPVLVWIHGGAYAAGSAADPLYDAALLARQGGLVVVTLNYRVGAEGFAALEDAPANRGLLDQIAALRWVRENIRGFGGDPDRVTVCGQSAGAGSIASLLAAPPARGLFRRAIAQSVPGLYFTPALAADIAAVLAGRVDAKPTVESLSAVAPQRLADAAGALTMELTGHVGRWGRAARGAALFAPVVDGDLVPDVPWRAVRDGRAADVELMVCHTRDEFRLFMVMTGRLGGITEEEATAALRAFAPGPGGEHAYRESFPGASAGALFETVYADALFRMPSLRLAEAHSAAGGPAYLAELCGRSPALGGALGACHSLDVPLLFGTFGSPAGRGLLGEGAPSAGTVAFADGLRRAWTAFAHDGDPGWPAYEPGRRLTRLLGPASTTAPYPEETSRRIWDGHGIEPFDLVRPHR